MKLTIDLSKQVHKAIVNFAKGNDMFVSEAINYALADYFSNFEKEYNKLHLDRLKYLKREIKHGSRAKKVLDNFRNLYREWIT